MQNYMIVCENCEEKFEQIRAIQSRYQNRTLHPAHPLEWFLASIPCQNCGTSMYGRRHRHLITEQETLKLGTGGPTLTLTQDDKAFLEGLLISLEEVIK